MASASIRLDCQDAPEAMCSALASELARQSDHPVTRDPSEAPAALIVRLEVLSLQPTLTSARLTWHRPGEPVTQGPEMTMSSIDGRLPARAAAELARSLLRKSELPLPLSESPSNHE